MYQDDNDNNNYFNNDDPTPNFDEGSNFDLKSGAPDVVKNAVSVNFTLGFAVILFVICLIVTIFTFSVMPGIKATKLTEDNYAKYLDYENDVSAQVYDEKCTMSFKVRSTSENKIVLTAVFEITCMSQFVTKEVTLDCILTANQETTVTTEFEFANILGGSQWFFIRLVSIKGRILQ